MGTIAGALTVKHNIDPNGSLTINVPLLFPNAKAMPEMSLAYHSASSAPSPLGLGWVLKGAPIVERVSATIAQDGFRGVVGYDKDDRFSLDGQRIVKIGTNEYRFEVEHWSKIVAHGTDPSNPDSWTEHLPDGCTRTFGATSDSNVKALGKNATRVWAVSECSDPFGNYMTFSYNNDTTNGSYYLASIKYGGNKALGITHQRQISIGYEERPDKTTVYLGGYKIHSNKRVAAITSYFQSKIVHKYSLKYDTSPLTKVSRLLSIALTDAAGSSVLPLTFNWVDANNAVFDDTRSLGTISAGVSAAQILPLDVNATGRSDIVLASKQYDESLGISILFLSVYLADGKGNISIKAAPGSGSTGLQYPTQLLPLDMNGDGRTDLVHIYSSPIDGTHAITLLLSTTGGYKKQDTLTFTPESTTGRFYSGDFEGNGRIGLVYVYQILDNDGLFHLKFVQFTSDGVQFSALDARNGPDNATLEKTRVVIGDLNGNGADDVFLISPVISTTGSNQYCAINFLKSINGRLSYQSDGPLRSSGSNILFKSSTNFLGFTADGDGKTSLLAVSRDINGYLELQLLRSTGTTLLADSQPTVTSVLYNGNLTVNRVSSTNTVDLINSFSGISSPQLDIFRFDGEKFSAVNGVLQPRNVSAGATVRWADLRGVGRVDCLLGSFDVLSGDLSVHAMSCSSLQPIDYISNYDNGIGASTSITYAPLSDPDTYSTSGDTAKYAVSFMNAMSRNVASSIALTATSSQDVAHSRTELVHYPSYVVRHLSTCLLASRPDVTEDITLAYANARVSFDGRGWLGFESISKISKPVGLAHKTKYFQQFPLLGQVSDMTISDNASGRLLQACTYPWTFVRINGNTNYATRLPSLKETYYESGTYAYDVSVSMTYDDFSNLTVKTTTSSQLGVSPLSIESTFDNNTQLWIIGSKLSEAVKQDGVVLRQSKHVYLPGTRISKETSMWVAGSQWSTRTFEFDQAGNETSAKGPNSAYQTFVYDETYSNLVSATTYSTDTDSLTETATYDLALGKPLTVTDPNGLNRSYEYDVLGRVVKVSEGESLSAMTCIEGHSFQYTTKDGFSHTRLVLSGRDKNDSGWCKMVAYTDGLYQTWKTKQSTPDNLESFVYSDTIRDGAGRVISTSRDYVVGSQPVFTTYTYDSQSRLVQKIEPPDALDLPSITTTYRYTVKSGSTVVTEARSDGISANNQVTVKTLSYLPNPDPSTNKLVLPFLTSQSDALGQTIQTRFDGLARPISVTDPSGVYVTMAWDGLSRQTARRIFNGAGETANLISHFTSTFDDASLRALVKNELTGSTKVTRFDYANRVISQVTADESLTFLYDIGGKFSKGQLVKSTSSKGIEHVYDYDIRGHLIKSSLSIDNQTFTSALEWTPGGQLSKATNPDGSTLTRSFFPDGETVQKVTLADRTGSTQASVTFSNSTNAFSRPLTCAFGNGITSQSTLSSNGSPSSQTLTNSNGASVLQQTWKLEPLGKIQKYRMGGVSIQTKDTSFQYDLAGQLRSHLDGASSTNPQLFSYDRSGNITSKDGNNFINDGWKLDAIQDQNGTTKISFKYSVDGNTTAKLDSSGAVVNSMAYDDEGRLTTLDGTTFVYDYGGRMIKATAPNGDVTYYPSPNYEVSIPVEGNTCLKSYIIHGSRRAAFSSYLTSDGKVDSTAVYYFHSDHIGSTVAVSDKSGAIITSYQYDSFGAVVVDGPDVARYKFSGKEKFGDFYYFGARFYDPEAGRFLTLDNFPIDLKNLAPCTLNMYAFSRNDPINFVDMNGYAPWWHWLVDALLTVAGAILSFIPLPGMAFIGGAVLGAGISGFTYDASAEVLSNGVTKDSDYFIQLGLGAAFGFVSAGVGALFDMALPAGSIVEIAASRGITGSIGKAAAGKLIGRTVIRMGVNGAAGGLLGVGQQAVTNLINGDPITKDLGQSAWLGAVSGLFFGAIFEAREIFVLKPSARLKFWTGKKWGVFHREMVEFRAGEGGGTVRIHPDYPNEVVLTSYSPLPKDVSQPLSPTSLNPATLADTPGNSTSLAWSTSVAGPSNTGSSRRFLPVNKVTSL